MIYFIVLGKIGMSEHFLLIGGHGEFCNLDSEIKDRKLSPRHSQPS